MVYKFIVNLFNTDFTKLRKSCPEKPSFSLAWNHVLILLVKAGQRFKVKSLISTEKYCFISFSLILYVNIEFSSLSWQITYWI